jgi:hypothetical protein
LISVSHIIKRGTTNKKKGGKPKERKEKNIMSGEKSGGEEKMDKCSMSQKNLPLRKKA